MLEFRDMEKYDRYAIKLKTAIEKNSYQEFMKENRFYGIYLKQENDFVSNICQRSMPYYDEISIENIASWNSSDSTILDSNWSRVIGAVKFILENKCMPISVIKLDNGRYYIENGKHRFYAHVLLGHEQIPVSVREILKENSLKGTMLNYNIPFYNNDGMDIAYPEKVEAFIDQYMSVESQIASIVKKVTEISNLIADVEKNIDPNDRDLLKKQLIELVDLHHALKAETREIDDDFAAVKLEAKSVEMKATDDNRHTLSIAMSLDREIVITGSCSSGNATRASKCTCNILNKLGYQVDMKYVSEHSEFRLEDKRDAHNLKFDVDIDETAIKNDILPNLKSKMRYDETQDLQCDFFKLIDYISRYKPFETPGTHFSCYSSSFIQVNLYNYFLVGAENKESVDSIYLFRSSEIPFNNLTITFLGKIRSETDLYKKLK